MSSALRLFFALWPHAAARAEIERVQQFLPTTGMQLVSSANLHLTLAFLGSVEKTIMESLMECAATLTVPAFRLTLDHAEHGPGMLWLAPSEIPPPLMTLAGDLRRCMHVTRLPVEQRAYRPHVTLARKAPHAIPLPAIEPIDWDVGCFCLLQSLMQSGSTVYRSVRCWPLKSL